MTYADHVLSLWSEKNHFIDKLNENEWLGTLLILPGVKTGRG